MATITKLKAAVNNKNLPILSNDGYLYNYYIGRYVDKMSELDYTLTEPERNALNTFINNGIEKNWIDKVLYFMPFIGTETTPLQGAVPLIDNIADYELAVNSVDSSLFTFDNDGKIKSFGGSPDCTGSIEIPVTTFDLGLLPAFSAFINVNYLEANGDDKKEIKGTFVSAYNSNNSLFGIRKGASGYNSIQYGRRTTDAIAFNAVTGTAYVEDAQLNVYATLRKNIDNSLERENYSTTKGDTTINHNTVSITSIPTEEATYFVGGGTRNLTTVMNCFAIVKPFITESDFYNLSQAVFALTTALGRDIPSSTQSEPEPES